ncbi:MAG TPA: CoA pyrophosphatase [Acidimicrobiales bacterium]|nr:CoA pyrophosphatase [Acidimicrobiales bacterium]
MADRRPEPGVPPQIIPRPPSARPGTGAPWTHLDPADRQGLTLGRVLDDLALAGRLGPAPDPLAAPFVELWDTLVPVDRAALAAVLVALFEEHGETRVVLTRRSDRLRSHRGEVSFPGGRAEPGEEAPAAAIRESVEEVALDPAAVTVVGWLSPVLTVASGSLIAPVVATLPGRPVLVANPAEVARVFDVALADLLADGVFSEELWSVPGPPGQPSPGVRPIWFFEAAGEMIWGATARILVDLLAVACGVEVPLD